MGRALNTISRIRYQPTTRLQSWVIEARTPEEIVDTLCERLLGLPVTEDSRESLIVLLQGETGRDAAFKVPSEARLRRIARVILSLPEALVC